MKLSPLADRILKERYLLPNETPRQMLRRVAEVVASAEDTPQEARIMTERFLDMMLSMDFLPNSPTLMNAGNELGQLSACFVLPIEDSMDGICGTLHHQAIIHKSGGGTGFSFSRLRPEGATVGSTGGVASGPISFMRVYNEMTETVKQGGKRRGANMGCLRVDHPDIEKFIDAKLDKTVLTNFNLSVSITDEFMKAVNDVDSNASFTLRHESTPAVKHVNAKQLFNKIAINAHSNGEPGVLFIDQVNGYHPMTEDVESTNPCGEQPLLPNESCNLGSVNLSNMVMQFKGKTVVDWDKFKKTTTLAVRFLDNVVTVNKYPLQQIADKTRDNRKIGLGVMGLADMFIKLGIEYDTNKAVELSRKLAKYFQDAAHEASTQLAVERGAFPNYPDTVKPAMLQHWGNLPRRNATVTTIAPTGTLSIIADCSGGIEPNFAFKIERRQGNANQPEISYHPLMKEHVENGLYNKRVFVEANNVSWEYHLKHQVAWQESVENAVSKTINMASAATIDDVKKAYMMAWETGCKGVTVYRDGSRDAQVLTKATDKKPANAVEIAEKRVAETLNSGALVICSGEAAGCPNPSISAGTFQRPEQVKGTTTEWKTGCGTLYVTYNTDENGVPFEVFVNDGGMGGCMSQSTAITKVISVAMQAGVPAMDIAKKVKGIRCPSCTNRGLKALSCPDAIGKTIERMAKVPAPSKKNTINIADPVIPAQTPIVTDEDSCPSCGVKVVHASGCVQCIECGWGKCN